MWEVVATRYIPTGWNFTIFAKELNMYTGLRILIMIVGISMITISYMTSKGIFASHEYLYALTFEYSGLVGIVLFLIGLYSPKHGFYKSNYSDPAGNSPGACERKSGFWGNGPSDGGFGGDGGGGGGGD